MANKVYMTTHDCLTHLVSARVASQRLDNALRTAGLSAESVSAQQMAHVIKGPVVQELATILPRAGLERSLKNLLKTLQALPADEAHEDRVAGLEAAPGDTAAEPELGHETDSREAADREADVQIDSPTVAKPVRLGRDWGVTPTGAAASGIMVGKRVAEPSAAKTEHTQLESLPELTSLSMPAATAPTSTAPSATPVLERKSAHTTLGAATRDAAVLVFAELEHVETVAAFEAGIVSAVRGGGFDLEALSRLGTLGLKLLGRSGELRTFYVAHSRGQLFLFPLGEVTLMLIGSSELNLGLVFATLHKLKEEL